MPEDKRRYTREECFFVGTVGNKLVYVADVSKGGMKLISADPIGKVGDIIKFNAHIPSDILEDIIIELKIVWVRKMEEEYGFLTGIEFMEVGPEFEKNIKHIIELNEFIIKIRKNLLS